jgi:hypothetical protein
MSPAQLSDNEHVDTYICDLGYKCKVWRPLPPLYSMIKAADSLQKNVGPAMPTWNILQQDDKH